ncbi:hypothetical protein J6590_077810 [Homalodisca vitripennis]|nr:hypothetical protein J6590_077810 [Homalodisca vitripennis]
MVFSPASKQTAFLNATDGLRRSSVKKCSNCGEEVTASNLSRHQKTKKCIHTSSFSIVNRPYSKRVASSVIMAFSPASKQTAFLNATDGLRRSSVKKCPNCGAEVTASNLSRHQKTKKCMSASNPPAYASSNGFNKKPPSMKQVCSRCGVEVRNSSMSHHKKTKKCMSTLDRQTPDFDMSMLENYADAVSDNQFQNVIADFDMSMLPESYSNLRPEEQDAIADFDLSMLDTPDFYSKIRAIIGPSTADAPKFEPPVKRIHPDSSKIISILGPPPFEVPDKSDYSLHIPYSPVYHSPLHIPESPTYNVLSPTDVRAQIKPQKKPCPKCTAVSKTQRRNKYQLFVNSFNKLSGDRSRGKGRRFCTQCSNYRPNLTEDSRAAMTNSKACLNVDASTSIIHIKQMNVARAASITKRVKY